MYKRLFYSNIQRADKRANKGYKRKAPKLKYYWGYVNRTVSRLIVKNCWGTILSVSFFHMRDLFLYIVKTFFTSFGVIVVATFLAIAISGAPLMKHCLST